MLYSYELLIGCSISLLFHTGETESYSGKGGGEEGFLDIKKAGGSSYILSDKKAALALSGARFNRKRSTTVAFKVIPLK